MHKLTTNLKGKVFGLLTVLEISDKPENSVSKNRGTYWKCVCTCGNSCTVRSTELSRGDTKSCGCLKKRSYQNNPLYKGVGDLPKSMFTHMVYAAKKRNLEVSIDMNYLWELFLNQKGKCFYTGYDITLNTRNNKKTASVDRLDSSKGYTKDNVVWCRKDINIMKMDKSVKDFYEICRMIAKRNP